MAKRYMKRCSTSPVIRKTQIKTTKRYHLTAVRMAIIRKRRGIKSWRGCRERGSLVHCWWECKLVQPLWKTAWRLLKKLKMELLCDASVSFLGIYLKEIITLKRFLYFHMPCSTIHNCQGMEIT